MSGNYDSKIVPALAANGPHLIADKLLDEFVEALLSDPVMQTLFGSDGDRIFVDDLPSINESILPLIQLAIVRETFASNFAYHEGTVMMQVMLPTQLIGQFQNLRRIAAVFMRFFGSKRFNIFDPVVPGLTKFGYQMSVDYTQVQALGGSNIPCITFTIPFTIDMLLLQNTDPSYDFGEELDAGDLGFAEDYVINLLGKIEDQTVEATVGVTVETGQTN